MLYNFMNLINWLKFLKECSNEHQMAQFPVDNRVIERFHHILHNPECQITEKDLNDMNIAMKTYLTVVICL